MRFAKGRRKAPPARYELLPGKSAGPPAKNAGASASVGSVCERLVRRSHVDTLVIKEPERGFLGMGARTVLIPFEKLQWSGEDLYLPVEKDVLEKAPEFDPHALPPVAHSLPPPSGLDENPAHRFSGCGEEVPTARPRPIRIPDET